ncbi:MAG: GHKL domain-containing protein [Bacteroides sp.]|nr:GHKL domain-containing protein [Bacteroides sp.]MCM1549428.1 GHKL domain-containing protein [Clostridium sp.]
MNLGSAIFLIVYVGFFYLISIGILGEGFTFLFLLGLAWYWVRTTGQGVLRTAIKLLLALILVGFLETLVMFLFIPVAAVMDGSVMIQFYMSMTTMLAAALLFIVLRKRPLFLKIRRVNKNLIWCTVLAAVFLAYIKFDFEQRRSLHILFYLLAFVVLVVVFVGIFREQQAGFELEKKELELNLQKQYDGAYRELLNEVRQRQHDYKNQLTALYSMHLTATSFEELVAMQQSYGNLLLEKGMFDSILTGCNNSILAGYIYSVCTSFEKEGIIIRPDVKVYGRECSRKISDIIEILGVLLNNAYESVSEQEREGNCIRLVVLENHLEFYIEVSNISDYISNKEIEAMFQMGYSTKGEKRGLGLYSVKSIAKRYESNILVDNYQENNDNWFRFKILIGK